MVNAVIEILASLLICKTPTQHALVAEGDDLFRYVCIQEVAFCDSTTICKLEPPI
jgi:hypothetical protein